MTRKKPSESLSFRLSGPLLDRLQEEATALELSPDLHAKAIVVSMLQDEHRLQVIEELRAVREDIHRLRADVATTLETVLLNVTKVSPEEARAFVRDTLRSS